MAELNHPNIVRVIHFAVTTDARRLPYLVMGEASGQSLYRILKEAKRHRTNDGDPVVGVSEAFNVAIELFDALAYLHDQKVIHCDVKPANIILQKEGARYVTKLIDFGCARKLAEDGAASGAPGTPLYAAPEQWDNELLTPKTDVYSAGHTLYEMLVGSAPFAEYTRSMEALKRAHSATAPEDA